MEVLEVQLTVPGHATFEQPVRDALISGEGFKRLPHIASSRLLKPFPPNTEWLAIEIQEAAVFIKQDWGVVIYGKRLINCVSAMCVVVSAIGQRLEAPVTIGLLTPTDANRSWLHRQLNRESRKTMALAVAKWSFTILASAAAGALLSWFIGG